MAALPQRTLTPEQAVAAAGEMIGVIEKLGTDYSYHRGYLGDASPQIYKLPVLGDLNTVGGMPSTAPVVPTPPPGYAYDESGQLVRTDPEAGTLPATPPPGYAYDESGQLVRTDPEAGTLPATPPPGYAYDESGQLVRTDPEAGTLPATMPPGYANEERLDRLSLPTTQIDGTDSAGVNPSTQLSGFRAPTSPTGSDVPFGFPSLSPSGASTTPSSLPTSGQPTTVGLPGFPSYSIGGADPATALSGKSMAPTTFGGGGGGGGYGASPNAGLSASPNAGLSASSSGGGAFGRGGAGTGSDPTNLSGGAARGAGRLAAPSGGGAAGLAGGAPMMPMMPMGGGGGVPQQQQGQQEQSSSKDWLQEDQSVWEVDADGASPRTLGRH